MQETLLIRLSRGGLETAEYAVVDPAGRLLTPQQQAPLADLAAQAAGREVVVLAPAEAVVLVRIHMPTQSRSQLRKAVPYAVEDHFTQDVETLHFAFDQPDDDGRLLVAAVARTEMKSWVEALETAGIEAAEMVPEPLAVPEPGDGSEASLLWEPERWVLRRADGAACAGLTQEWATLAPLVVPEESEAACRVDLFPAARAEPPPLPEGCSPGETREANYPLEHLAMGLAGNRERINLLQGEFGIHEDWGELLKPWRAAALVLAGLVLVTLVADGVRYYRLKQTQQQLAARIEAVYRQTFPNARRIVNPRVQMDQKLKALRRARGGEGGGFMELLARTGEVLRQADSVRIQGLSYRDGRLELLVDANDVQSLDKAKQLLAGKGLKVEIQSASSGQGGRVKGRLRIREGSA